MSTEDIRHLQNQLSVARSEIKNLRQQVVALKHDYRKDCETMLEVLSDLRKGTGISAHGSNSAVRTSDSIIKPSTSNEKVSFQPVGVIESDFTTKRCVPRQPSVSQSKGVIRLCNNVLTNPDHALIGLEEYSHLWIIFHFHSTGSSRLTQAKVAPPRASNTDLPDGSTKPRRFGVFATRAPHRPCPIGLSLVKIEKVEGNCIYFSGVDMVNGTPVLDLKPYIPDHDTPQSLTSFRAIPDAYSDLERATSSSNPATSESLIVSKVELPLAEISLESSEADTPLIANDISATTQLAPTTLQSPLSAEVQNFDYISEIETRIDGVGSYTWTSFSNDFNNSVEVLGADTPDRRPGVSTVSSEENSMERGMPDGQERRTPPTPAPHNYTSPMVPQGDAVRVANWLSNPSVPKVSVNFTPECLLALRELTSERSQTVKSEIISVLQEDPRSSYVRIRYPSHPYHCAVAGVAVTCIFDDVSHECTVQTISSVDSIQNM